VAYQAGQPLARRIPSGCLARLVQQSDGKPAVAGRGGGPWGVPGLVGQLTGRALDVLRMLATGMPNQAIAEELFVTLFTVKKHVSHVLSKLGAASRTEAAAPGTRTWPDPRTPPASPGLVAPGYHSAVRGRFHRLVHLRLTRWSRAGVYRSRRTSP